MVLGPADGLYPRSPQHYPAGLGSHQRRPGPFVDQFPLLLRHGGVDAAILKEVTFTTTPAQPARSSPDCSIPIVENGFGTTTCPYSASR